MKKEAIHMQTLDVLIVKCIKSVITHGEESWGGHYKVANKHYDIFQDCLRQISEFGETGYEALKSLLTHENPYVRVAFAFDILGRDPEIALPVLQSVAELRGGAASSAKTILSEYAKGRLKLRYWPKEGLS